MSNEEENLLAILGPTNTGKTYTAFEKLFSYSSGIFGFPLRLLARENYDKAVKRIGLSNVALITGEEKILPKEAKYFFCTVESMPKNISADCIIIDEVQLAADYERGHIFTDRILNLRGNFITIFLGSLNIEIVSLPKILRFILFSLFINSRGNTPIPIKFDLWILSKLSAITALTPKSLVPLAAQSLDDPVPYSLPAIITVSILFFI